MMAITIDSNKEGYFHGDKVKLTGKKDKTTYSFPLSEFVFVDGRFKGETFWQPIVIFDGWVGAAKNP